MTKQQLVLQDNIKRKEINHATKELLNDRNFSFSNEWSLKYFNSLMSVKENIFVIDFITRVEERTNFSCNKYKITQIIVVEYNSQEKYFQQKRIELKQEKKQEYELVEFKKR